MRTDSQLICQTPRARILIWLLVSTLICFIQPLAAAENAAARPNILFLFADDLGYGDLACYGHPDIWTPHLDRLAAEGTLFKHFYVNGSVCSPSRAAVMTGQYPSRHRIFSHLAYSHYNRECGMPNWLDPAAPQLPRLLRQAGYRTAHFGKWHLGGGSSGSGKFGLVGDPAAPAVTKYGYDVARITLGNGPTWKLGQRWPQRHDVYQYEDHEWTVHSSRLIIDETIDFLEDHARRDSREPFFVNVWFKDPHKPLAPTVKQRSIYAHLPEPQQTYYAVVSNLDAQIGRLLKRLDELQLSRDTLVIFSSDNGPAKWGKRKPGVTSLLPAGQTNNAGVTGGLRGHKRSLYDGGIRVPFIVRWPGHTPAGRVDTSSVLAAVDLLPTFCQIGKATLPADYEPDGEDVSLAWKNQDWSRDRPIFWEYRLANLDDDSKQSPMLVARQSKWKLLMNPDRNRVELFDVVTDPGEYENLAAQHAVLVQRLASQLLAWKTTLPPETHVRQDDNKEVNEQRWAAKFER